VGKDKLEYDVWGDTVNVASRMESYGTVNKVNVSDKTYDECVNFFCFEDRGKIPVKMLGNKQMYFVLKIKDELTDDGINPNHTFNIKLQYLTYKILEINNIAKLQEGSQENLFYHNARHTTDVIYSVEDIGKKENVSDEDMLLLKCAALFHDMGFLISYDNHEEESVKIAQQQLKQYNFSDRQIQIVSRLILATKSNVKPQNLLEEIICDADLFYIISSDFIPISRDLYAELYAHGKINNLQDWKKLQSTFIENHTYYTRTAQKNITKKEVLMKILNAPTY
jgi:HD superfamily phosphodiesterase